MKDKHVFYTEQEMEVILQEAFRLSISDWTAFGLPVEMGLPLPGLMFTINDDSDITRVFPIRNGHVFGADICSYNTQVMVLRGHFLFDFDLSNDSDPSKKTHFNIPLCPLKIKTSTELQRMLLYIMRLYTKRSVDANGSPVEGKKYLVAVASKKTFQFMKSSNGSSDWRKEIPWDSAFLLHADMALDILYTFAAANMYSLKLITEPFLLTSYCSYCPYCPSRIDYLKQHVTPESEVEKAKNEFLKEFDLPKDTFHQYMQFMKKKYDKDIGGRV